MNEPILTRLLQRQALETLQDFPAAALLGPRQCGKTTLALELAEQLGEFSTYVDLELPSHRARLADPEVYFNANAGRLVILDEIHQAPEIFRVLRGIIDDRRRRGRRSCQFLLLGSASLELLRQSSESLAGRIAFLELTPLLIAEVAAQPDTPQERLWLRGGFPNSFLARTDQASLTWRRSFIKSYLERDIPMLAPRLPAETLFRLWQMLAHQHGQQVNVAQLGQALAVSGQTIGRYLDTLADLLLIRRLAPWAENHGKRLVRSPKIYLRDSGVLHALLGLRDINDVLGHPVSGASFEGMVIENIIAAAPPGSQPWFYRTSAGAEIDLVIQLPRGGRWAFEVKLSSAPVPSKGFHIACDDVAAEERFIIYPGRDPYPHDKKTKVLPFLSIPALFHNTHRQQAKSKPAPRAAPRRRLDKR